MLKKLDGVVTHLPRGGVLVDTPAGYIQFGSPPETIKDTMTLPNGIPNIFVLPEKLFTWDKGISVAEIEFPIYFNFFIRHKKTFILCSEEQFIQMKAFLNEAVFGPKELDIKIDFDDQIEESVFPDLKSEMDFFRNGLKLSDLVAFGIFKNSKFTIQGITIKKTKDTFLVLNKNEKIAEVRNKVEYKSTYEIGERLPEPFKPPLFGITCLGPSHGFDPTENTSGFIIWLNHQGVMVDPPVNSTEWLEDSNVNPKLIEGVILTHCHADHDAGTFQKILEEGRITLYATQTILNSFLKKYSSLTKVSEDYLKKLFAFRPIKIGSPLFIYGGKFRMFYTLHSIPTIGFKMEFQDQSFVYSSDHNNNPEIHSELYKDGKISKERYKQLSEFPWDSKVIYHESGVPPLHTPISYLNSLPEEVQKRIVVYHIAKKDFPEDTNLTLAKFGIENTLYFETVSPNFEKANQILLLLKNLDFLHNIDISKAQEFLDIVVEEQYKKGELIIKMNTPGDKFYIIHSGNISVDSGGLAEKKIYGTYEYFGEVALVTKKNRTADVFAETDVIIYSIERDKFLNFISGTKFENTLLRLAKIRNSETWNLLSTSQFFQICTASQKTWLESMFNPIEYRDSGILINNGDLYKRVYIIRKGEVFVYLDDREIAVLKKGDFVGSLQSLHKGQPSRYCFKYKEDVLLYYINREDIFEFLDQNPGLIMKLSYEF